MTNNSDAPEEVEESSAIEVNNPSEWRGEVDYVLQFGIGLSAVTVSDLRALLAKFPGQARVVGAQADPANEVAVLRVAHKSFTKPRVARPDLRPLDGLPGIRVAE